MVAYFCPFVKVLFFSVSARCMYMQRNYADIQENEKLEILKKKKRKKKINISSICDFRHPIDASYLCQRWCVRKIYWHATYSCPYAISVCRHAAYLCKYATYICGHADYHCQHATYLCRPVTCNSFMPTYNLCQYASYLHVSRYASYFLACQHIYLACWHK
jgi:hypothetical protein